jgi:hypothetical protein
MSWALVFRIGQYVTGSRWALPVPGFALGAVLAGLDGRLETWCAVRDHSRRGAAGLPGAAAAGEPSDRGRIT